MKKMYIFLLLLLILNPAANYVIDGNVLTIEHKDGTYSAYKFEEVADLKAQYPEYAE